MSYEDQGWGKQTLACLGATLREASRSTTEEPLPSEFLALLLLLEQAETEQEKQPHNPPHWTSDREPQKSQGESIARQKAREEPERGDASERAGRATVDEALGRIDRAVSRAQGSARGLIP